ncbi:MAG: FecR domain-containing protein, partial [Chlorobi bacterium]|nr:FecR domain-containing protein [Chlorobiota bacterium]
MTDELLFKYITGQAGRDEVKYVQDWSSSSEMRKEKLARIKNIWILSGLGNKIDPAIKEAEIQKIWAKVRELNRQEKKKSLQSRWVKYAAAIILLIGISGAAGMFISQYNSAFPPKYAEIIVPNGERSTIVLPDGSTVKLNSGSRLKFPSNFSSGKRQVILQGEGFFNVTHDKSSPFIVVASDIRVEVLGTRFNISCYPNDEIIETYLESGKIKVNLDDKKHESILMNPLEALKFNKTTGKYLKYTLK